MVYINVTTSHLKLFLSIQFDFDLWNLEAASPTHNPNPNFTRLFPFRSSSSASSFRFFVKLLIISGFGVDCC
ncbi:hypothetical protein P8452_05215 [Trifolium repens]|nr:hypothetical protein P8452_05215 [Trifolium repens]